MFTYPSALLAGGHRHIRIPLEIHPYVGVVLDHRNMTDPLIKEFVIKGLLYSPHTLLR